MQEMQSPCYPGTDMAFISFAVNPQSVTYLGKIQRATETRERQENIAVQIPSKNDFYNVITADTCTRVRVTF